MFWKTHLYMYIFYKILFRYRNTSTYLKFSAAYYVRFIEMCAINKLHCLSVIGSYFADNPLYSTSVPSNFYKWAFTMLCLLPHWCFVPRRVLPHSIMDLSREYETTHHTRNNYTLLRTIAIRLYIMLNRFYLFTLAESMTVLTKIKYYLR